MEQCKKKTTDSCLRVLFMKANVINYEKVYNVNNKKETKINC